MFLFTVLVFRSAAASDDGDFDAAVQTATTALPAKPPAPTAIVPLAAADACSPVEVDYEAGRNAQLATSSTLAKAKAAAVRNSLNACTDPMRKGALTAQVDALDAAIDYDVARCNEVWSALYRAQDLRGDGKLDDARTKLAEAKVRAEFCETADEQYANEEIVSAREKLRTGRQPGCEGATFCLIGGIMVASIAFTGFAGPREGETSHQLASVALPTIGARYAWGPYYSVDLVVYTSLFDSDFKQTNLDPKDSGCREGQHEFEDRLPCEGEALLRTYGAAALMVSFGSDVGIISPGLTAGLARTTQEPTVGPYYGIMVATGGIFKSIPVGQ